MADQLFADRYGRADRRRRWDQRLTFAARSTLSGAARRPNGDTVKAMTVIAAFVIFVCLIGAVTSPIEAAQAGRSMSAWESVTRQSTWGIGTLMCSAVVYVAMRIAPPGRAHWPQLLLALGVGSLAFSVAHVALLNLLRTGLYSVRGLHYRPERLGFVYHYEKDLIAYVIIATILWLVAFRDEPGTAAHQDEGARTTFDIEDGKRVTRVLVKEIAAVRAARNYVEFLLTDGRRPLVRGTLAELQGSLGQNRFVRVHRSWLVNGDLVRELKPGRWGDFVVILAGDVAAPLSRRFPNALARLRSRKPRGGS